MLCQVSRPVLPVVILTAVAVFCGGPAHAGRFMTIVEAETFAPGEGELVQAGSLTRLEDGTATQSEGSWQIGLEYGLLPRLQVGLALPAWTVVSGEQGTETDFDGTALWGVWNLVPPADGSLGLSLAASVSRCAAETSGEYGLVLERSGGALALVANLSFAHCHPHDPGQESGDHLLARGGVSRDLGHGFALALEGEWLADRFGSLGYRAESFNWGPALLWEGGRAWVLGGALLDPDPLAEQRGAAWQVQAGVPF
ncbi:hypothetical protein KDM41_13165 [bacterium]|nr:hypothetical protein [bacterium]